MTDWFRSWHGAPTDFRWLAVARRSGTNAATVSAVVWALLDHASQNSGSVKLFDRVGFADYSEIPLDKVNSIISNLELKGFLSGNQVRPWRRRRPWFEPDDRRPPPAEWRELREAAFKRDGYSCTYCGSTGPLECDHVVPVAKGGSHELSNLTTACRDCNQAKRDKLLGEWKPELVA